MSWNRVVEKRRENIFRMDSRVLNGTASFTAIAQNSQLLQTPLRAYRAWRAWHGNIYHIAACSFRQHAAYASHLICAHQLDNKSSGRIERMALSPPKVLVHEFGVRLTTNYFIHPYSSIGRKSTRKIKIAEYLIAVSPVQAIYERRDEFATYEK